LGSEKRKRKKRTDDFIETYKGVLDKFFKNNPSASTYPNNELPVVVAMEEEGLDIGIFEEEEENLNLNVNENIVSDPENSLGANGSSDVMVHDLIFELKILKCTLPNDTLSAMEIF
jgi:hypothetical protein